MKTARVVEKMRERLLAWWGCVARGEHDHILQRVKALEINDAKPKGRLKMIFDRKISHFRLRTITADLAMDCRGWRYRVHIADLARGKAQLKK